MGDPLLNNPAFLGIAAFGFVAIVAVYVYTALALMTIAKRTNTKNAWLAWIPIVNIYLMAKIGKLPLWSLILWLLVLIPWVGNIASVGLTIWYWWAISEQRKRPGWFGILMIVPIVNLVLMGLLAWGKDSSVASPKRDVVAKKPAAKKPAKKVAKKKPAKK